MKSIQLLISILFLAIFLTACGQDSAPEVVESSTATAVPATDTPAPTDTPEPTNTPESTQTPEPTHTPEPTNTPEPTQTKEPAISSGNFSEVELENGWIQYTLPEDDVAIAFPPEWTVLKLSAEFLEEALSAVGENNEGAMSALSTEAVQNMASAGIKLMALDTDPDVISRDTPTTANILIIELPIKLPFASWVELNLSQLDALATEGTLESEILEINNQQVARITYTAEIVTALGVPDSVRIEQYLFKQEETTYILTLASQIEIADRYEELFPEIANTFEILGAKE